MKSKEPDQASHGAILPRSAKPACGLRVLDGYAPRTQPPDGHAVLYLCTPERRMRRVVGPVVDEFHDAVWRDTRSTRLQISIAAPSYVPDWGDEPA